MEPILTIKHLKIEFQTVNPTPIIAVNDANLEAYPGQVTAIVGESGSGKSVTVSTVFQLLDENGKINTGEIILNGKNLLSMKEKELRKIFGIEISMIFQNPSDALNPSIKIKRQLVETIRTHKSIKKNEVKKICYDTLYKVGFNDPNAILNSYPFELSGGMCQRVMIAMAIILNPKVIIADEPTTALDVTTQKEILSELIKLKNNGTAIILITHDLSVVAHTADKVYVMKNGRIIESGNVFEIFENPKEKYTQSLINAVQFGGL